MLWFGGEEQGVEGDRMECVRVLSLSGKGSDKWQSLTIFNMEVIKFLHKHNFQFTVAEEGFQAWDTLQNSTDNSSIDKVETSLEWQEYFSQFQDVTDVLPCHIHLCVYMLVNHGPSQQSSKEENKPWKWGATSKYYTSHTKTMLPTRKSVPRSSRQLDHTKISWRS